MPHSPAPRALAVVLAAAAVCGLLLGCDDEGPAPTPASRSSAPAGSPSTATGGSGPLVGVYFVGSTPQGDRLFREQHRVSAGAPEAVAAQVATLSTGGDAVDPDYRSLWPRGDVDVRREGASVVVEVPAAWQEAGGLTPGQASLAVQQLTRSLVEALPGTSRLRVESDGAPARTLLGVDVGDGVRPAPDLDVLALVSIDEPAEGAAVPDTFTATGRASSPEATVPWRILDAGGTTVLTGFTTAAGWIDKLYPWSARVDVSSLRAGRYTFTALTDDPSEGEGGGATQDTRTIVVR